MMTLMKNASGESHANTIKAGGSASIDESNGMNSQSHECSANRKIKLDMSGALQMSWDMHARKNVEDYAENIPLAKVDGSFFHEKLEVLLKLLLLINCAISI
jgi:ABC-type uncharacterized transport system ATPase subunit